MGLPAEPSVGLLGSTSRSGWITPPKIRPKPPLAGGGLGNLIPKKLGQNLSELETEDLLLILILYLMYRESGDKELLIIMGAMYLL